MHACLRPSIEITTIWEIKDLFSINRDQRWVWLAILLLWTWLCMIFLGSCNCQFWMQDVLWNSLHVMWKCGAQRPLLHWILCNSDAWTLYVLMVIIGQHPIMVYGVSLPFINGQTTPSFSCSIKILWVWCWGLERERVFNGQLMPKRHYCLAQFLRQSKSIRYEWTDHVKRNHEKDLNMPRVEDLFGRRANETSRAVMAISFHIGTRHQKHAAPAIR
jgi:hypothetical protein